MDNTVKPIIVTSSALEAARKDIIKPYEERISELEKQHNHLRAIALDFEKERNTFLNQRNEYMTRLNRANDYLDAEGKNVKF